MPIGAYLQMIGADLAPKKVEGTLNGRARPPAKYETTLETRLETGVCFTVRPFLTVARSVARRAICSTLQYVFCVFARS